MFDTESSSFRARVESQLEVAENRPATPTMFKPLEPAVTMGDPAQLSGLVGKVIGDAIQSIRKDPTRDIQALIRDE